MHPRLERVAIDDTHHLNAVTHGHVAAGKDGASLAERPDASAHGSRSRPGITVPMAIPAAKITPNGQNGAPYTVR